MTFGPYLVNETANVQVAVWDRVITLPSNKEITVFSVSVQCSCWDQAKAEWVNTPFFRGSAVPVLMHGLQKAFHWIMEARNEARNE